jgi:NitT/TauT family transport system permease protein
VRPAVGVVIALALWELLTETGVLDRRNIPTVQAVASAMSGSASSILSSLGVTLESLFIGLIIASVAGTILGIAVGLSAWAEAGTDVIVRMMRPMPSLALIPIAILLAGLSTEMTSGLVAFAAFWPVFINARYGTRQAEPRLLETGRALGFSRLELIWRVVLPSAAPAVATGIRIAVGMATVVTVSVELSPAPAAWAVTWPTPSRAARFRRCTPASSSAGSSAGCSTSRSAPSRAAPSRGTRRRPTGERRHDRARPCPAPRPVPGPAVWHFDRGAPRGRLARRRDRGGLVAAGRAGTA